MSKNPKHPERFQDLFQKIQGFQVPEQTMRGLKFYLGDELGRRNLSHDQHAEIESAVTGLYRRAVRDAVRVAVEALERGPTPGGPREWDTLREEIETLEEQVSILRDALRDVFETLENEHNRTNEPIHNQELANQVANRARTAYHSTAERAQERVESGGQDGPQREAEYWEALAELYRAGLLEIVKAEPTAPAQEIARGTLRDAEQEYGHPAGPGAPEDGNE